MWEILLLIFEFDNKIKCHFRILTYTFFLHMIFLSFEHSYLYQDLIVRLGCHCKSIIKLMIAIVHKSFLETDEKFISLRLLLLSQNCDSHTYINLFHMGN